MGDRIGLIGLGAMGLPMMRNIIRRGYALTCFDISEQRLALARTEGAGSAVSCAEVARRSDIVISIVPTAKDVTEVLLGPDGVVAGAHPNLTVVEMSTIDAAAIASVDAALAERGVALLGAPVVRGVKAAESGTLAIYAGGDPVVFERCYALLQALGTDITFCGPIGTGNTVKIVNNMIAGVTMCMLSEALVLGIKGGVSTDVLFECLSKGSANGFVLQNHVKNHVLTGDFREGLFSINNEMKDLALALASADRLRVPQSFGALAYQTYQHARALGLAADYYPSVIKIAEQLAGVVVRSSAPSSESEP